MATPYNGPAPYAFVSYSHVDRVRVEAWLDLLESIGCRMWFDEGLTLSQEWNDELAAKVSGSSFVFFFASKDSVKSKVARRELSHADRHGIAVLPISLDGCELPDGLQFMLDKQLVRDDIDPKDALAKIRSDLPDELFGVETYTFGSETQLKRAWYIASGKAKKARRIIIAAALTVAASAILGIGLTLGRNEAASTLQSMQAEPAPAALDVYASTLTGYHMAGNYQTVDHLPEEQSEYTVSEAFSITSFIENTGDEGAFVESTRMDILSLEPVEEPVVLTDVGMMGNDFYVFAMNDGWGDADEPLELAAFNSKTGEEIPFDSICSEVDIAPSIVLPSGCVNRVARLSFDLEKFAANAGESVFGDAEVVIRKRLEDGSWSYGWTVVYSAHDGLYIFWPGIGDGSDYSITLFALLDVDQNPSSIIFTGAEANPLINGTFRVETVVAPTRSCHLQVRNVFTVTGQENPVQTEVYDVKVIVPRYETNGVFYRTGALTDQLLEDPDASMMYYTELAQPYRYDPTSILENHS